MSDASFLTVTPQTTDGLLTAVQRIGAALNALGGQPNQQNANQQSLVAGAVGRWAAFRSTNKSYTHRSRLNINADCRNLRFWFHGFKEGTYPTSQELFDNPYDLKMSVELADSSGAPTGTIIPVTFSGRRTVTIDPGAVIASDPCGLSINAGDKIFVRVYTTSSGTYVPVNRKVAGVFLSNGEGTSIPAADAVDSGAITAFDWGSALAPVAVTADTFTRSGVIVFGTSIDAYSSDEGFDHGGAQGYIARALANTRGYCNVALGGEAVFQLLADGRLYGRLPMVKYARTAIIDHGTNDLFVGARTVDQIKADMVRMMTLIRGAGIDRIVMTTIPPRNTSTDFWETTVNQSTTANESARLAYNAWILSDDCPADGVIDLLSTIEDSAGIWKGNSATSSYTTAAGSTTTVINVSGGGLTANSLCAKVVKISGSYRLISSNTSSAITLASALGGAPASGVAFDVLTTYTFDGIHPLPVAHAAMAAAVDTRYL